MNRSDLNDRTGSSTTGLSRFTWIILSIVLVLSCPLPGRGQGTPNLLPNPGFEIDDDGFPDGWTFAWEYTHSGDSKRGVEKKEPDARWDKEVVHSGKRSLFISNHRPQDDGVWTADDIPLGAGIGAYRLGAWIRTRDMNDTEALAGGVYLGESGIWLGADYTAIAVKDDRDWTFFTALLRPPPGTKKTRIRLWLNLRYSGTGAVWYDDLSLVPIERKDPPMQEYVDDRAMPDLAAEQQDKGYVCYARHYLRLIFPTSIPGKEEIGRPLSCFAAPGEREPVAFTVRALRDLRNVKVRVDSLTSPSGDSIGRERIEVRPVRYGPKQGQSR